MVKEFCIDYIPHDKDKKYCILKVKDGYNVVKEEIPQREVYSYEDLMIKLGYKEVWNYDCWAEFARRQEKIAEDKRKELETAQRYFDLFSEQAEKTKNELKEKKEKSCTWWNEDIEP